VVEDPKVINQLKLLVYKQLKKLLNDYVKYTKRII